MDTNLPHQVNSENNPHLILLLDPEMDEVLLLRKKHFQKKSITELGLPMFKPVLSDIRTIISSESSGQFAFNLAERLEEVFAFAKRIKA